MAAASELEVPTVYLLPITEQETGVTGRSLGNKAVSLLGYAPVRVAASQHDTVKQ